MDRLDFTYTNLIVHEGLQALDEFMLVPFINILLSGKKNEKDMVIKFAELGAMKMTQKCGVKGDYSLFLVQQLLQSIQ